MIDERILHFQVVTDSGTTPLEFSVSRIICAGYSGRSQDAVMEHVKELAALGMPTPETTPIFFQVSNYLATNGTGVTVQDGFTSGEAEFVLLFHGGDIYVTCGSDHTHRELERYSIPGAKQMHPKILGPVLWRFTDVEDHWDDLMLRSWATVKGHRQLYQEASLAHILPPKQLLGEAERHFKVASDGTIFMSGTLPTVGGQLVYADYFAFELQDPVRARSIGHGYEVSLLK